MSWSIYGLGQAGVTVLSLFGGFPKRIAPPDKFAWLWTGLASLVATLVFLAVKLLSPESWSYETFATLLWVEYLTVGLCAVLCFAYIWTLRSRTVEYANTLRIAGTELSDVAKDYSNANKDTTRQQLMEAFAGHTEEIWTPESLTSARFILAAEYALLIALLAFSLNLGIELLRHPVAKPPAPKEQSLADKAAEVQDVHFALNMSKLSEDASEKLSADAVLLNSIFQQFPKATLIIEGHCDDQGGEDKNVTLGYQRAEVVKNALAGDGIPVAKMSIASHGKGSPLCANLDERCRQKNRRVHLRVVE